MIFICFGGEILSLHEPKKRGVCKSYEGFFGGKRDIKLSYFEKKKVEFAIFKP
jgi:hypothetical protein